MSGHTGDNEESEEVTSVEEEQVKYVSKTEWTRFERGVDVVFTGGNLGVDVSYDNKGDRAGNELEFFSYIDWGQDSHVENYLASHDRMGKKGVGYTADLVRDPTTESVYLDFIDNEYAREMRQFPEEILNWTISDGYSDLELNHEISEIPNSLNESENYSIDSSYSISDFVARGEDTEDPWSDTTTVLSNELTSDVTLLDDSRTGNLFWWDEDPIVNSVLNFERDIAPEAHPEVDFFNLPMNWNLNPQAQSLDHINNNQYEAEKMEEGYQLDWGDSSKMELEDNTREPETYARQQKYIDAFFLEGVLDELMLILNIEKNKGQKVYIFDYIEKNEKIPITFRLVLYKKTNYLKLYRGLMVDLGLNTLMY